MALLEAEREMSGSAADGSVGIDGDKGRASVVLD